MLFLIELSINFLYFVLVLFLPGEIKKLGKETTRKISHILCGNWIFIFAYCNKYYLTDIIIMIIMIALMGISYKYNIFKGVERVGQDKSYGTIYFFVALFVFIVFSKLYKLDSRIYIIYFLPLVYGDAFAGILGQKINWIEYKVLNNKKTVSGSITMLLVSLVFVFLYNNIALDNYYTILQILIISIIASFMEAISVKGTDNFTIPICTMLMCEVIF